MAKKDNKNLPAKTPGPSADVLVKTLRRDLYDNRKTFAGLIGVPDDSQVFTSWLAEVSHVVSSNPKLLEANRPSLLMALRHAITMGLSINPALGEAWLIPRWDKNLRANVVQCQRGAQGVLALMYRSDMIDSVGCDVIYRGETYKICGGTDARIEHEPDIEGTNRTNNFDDIVVAYATVYLRGSSRPVFAYLTSADLARARAMNLDRNGNPSGPWRDHPQAMACKTALVRVCKMLPRHSKLAELHRALAGEVDDDGITVSEIDAPDDIGQSPWSVACDAFGQLGIEPSQLLAFIGIDADDKFTSEHDAMLREVYRKAKAGDGPTLALLSGEQDVVDVEQVPADA